MERGIEEQVDDLFKASDLALHALYSRIMDAGLKEDPVETESS